MPLEPNSLGEFRCTVIYIVTSNIISTHTQAVTCTQRWKQNQNWNVIVMFRTPLDILIRRPNIRITFSSARKAWRVTNVTIQFHFRMWLSLISKIMLNIVSAALMILWWVFLRYIEVMINILRIIVLNLIPWVCLYSIIWY